MFTDKGQICDECGKTASYLFSRTHGDKERCLECSGVTDKFNTESALKFEKALWARIKIRTEEV